MADEKQNVESIDAMKEQAAAARDALKEAASALHGLNRSISDEAYKGMKSDMSRTVFVGSITDEQREVYELVDRAQLAGQAAAMVRREQPAAEIIQEVMGEAEAVLRTASSWVK